MNKWLWVVCLVALVVTGSGYAATMEIWVDKGDYSGDAYRYYTYTEGNRKLSPCCWGWNSAESGSYVLMKWETGVNLSKNWSFQTDCKSANPYQVKTWAHVKQGGFGWKKCDSNMKSKISCNVSCSWSNNPNWCINMQVYGKQYTTSGWNLDLMIRPNYSGDKSGWTKVTVDGQDWYKSTTEWNSDKNLCRVVYAKKNKTYSHTINVKPFMEHMGCKNWYVNSLEFGWEVYTGSALWKVNSMGITP